MRSVKYESCNLYGETGKLLKGITANWLIGIRENNPSILEMFRERDLRPYRRLSSWSGEFAGKYLTSAAYVYGITGDEALKDYAVGFADELISLQAGDGYLGPFAEEHRLTGYMSQDLKRGKASWDAWGHYHCMTGLLLWYDITGKEEYFRCIERIAALFISRFYGQNSGIMDMNSPDTNLSVYHIFCILYRRTGKQEYLDFAKQVENEIESNGAGQYLRCALEGIPYYKCPQPRWESLHEIMGYAEMYRITGDEKYKTALLQIFHSILETDVHNTGAFSTYEMAKGDPFKTGPVETCCVVAYDLLAVEAFLLTGDPKVLDFLERAHFNAVLGYYCKTGRWSTYNTPMEGLKEASIHTIGFQCRAGSPEINCCSVNAPRGVATVKDWAVTKKDNDLYINFYEDSEIKTKDGEKISVSGGYPAFNEIKISVSGLEAGENVYFRIPEWSQNTLVTIGDNSCSPKAGEYFEVPYVHNEFEVIIRLDFSARILKGGGEFEGRSCVFIGPLLYGFDAADNGIFWENVTSIAANSIHSASHMMHKDGSSRYVLESGIVLKEFRSLGSTGNWYTTWLPIEE